MSTIWQEKFQDFVTLGRGTSFLTGVQALFAGQMLMRHVDLHGAQKTAGFIVGYRGSPLAGVDLLADRLKKARVLPTDLSFLSAINEEQAVGIAGGTQMGDTPRFREYAVHDGVTALVYMKHPGTMRASDAGAHVNYPGVAKMGGIVWASGDDPLCTSSTYTSASLDVFRGMKMPVLAPHSVTEIAEYVVRGFQLSRHSGLAVGLSLPASLLDASSVVSLDYRSMLVSRIPYPPHIDESWMHFREERDPLGIEERLYSWKLPAAQTFVRETGINRVVLRHTEPVLTIVCVGKALRDVTEALIMLQIDTKTAPISLVTIGCPYPLDITSIAGEVLAAETVLLVEEKSGTVEAELMRELAPYVRRAERIPYIIGRSDTPDGAGFPEWGELRPTQVAVQIGRILAKRHAVDHRLLAYVEEVERLCDGAHAGRSDRKAHYCAGCPHNTSTPVPDGAIAMAGIGCHVIEILYADRYAKFTGAMGTEGAHLIGAQLVSRLGHGYQNLGDGTYFHSGILSIRQALAVHAHMTFKILFNDAVAMTGGQRVDGELTVPRLVLQLKAEGVEHIVIVTDDIERYQDFPESEGEVFPREEMDNVMRKLAQVSGVSVLIYDQTCAAERRRRIKKGTLARAPKHTTHRVMIHPEVCEGCGDCSTQSNCLAVVPLHTPLGRVREIDQTSCNHDTRCLDGHCPSFVVIEEPLTPRDRSGLLLPHGSRVPEPKVFPLLDRWNIVLSGIGGTGILTIEQILGVAGWKEGYSVQSLAMTGMSQKFGAVRSHVRMARTSNLHASPAVPYGEADLLIACDVVGASAPQTMACIRPGTSVVLNTHETMPAEFLTRHDFTVEVSARQERLAKAVEPERILAHDFSLVTRRVFGDETYTNMLMLGFVSQQGLLPLSKDAILYAIELSGESVQQNMAAFMVGRLLNHDAPLVLGMAGLNQSVKELTVPERVIRLEAYGGVGYGMEYHTLLSALSSPKDGVSQDKLEAIVRVGARVLYRLMAIKDEYEVARMHGGGVIDRMIEETFAVDHMPKLVFQFAPPLLEKFLPKDARGLPRKIRIGAWARPLFRLLAKGSILRDTVFDPFGYTKDRRADKLWRARYVGAIHVVSQTLSAQNADLALELLAIPEAILGYGEVRRQRMKSIEQSWNSALTAYRTGVRGVRAEDKLKVIRIVTK